jgi:hypothetical protein
LFSFSDMTLGGRVIDGSMSLVPFIVVILPKEVHGTKAAVPWLLTEEGTAQGCVVIELVWGQ